MSRAAGLPTLALLVALLAVPAAGAQVDDPLYPLDIGGVWESETQSLSSTGGIYQMLRRERREVVGDTLLAGEAYRVVRLLTAAGNATGWTPAARCAVRVNRSTATPVVEWAAVAGTCAPPEQGMALAGAESGSFSVSVVGQTVAFSTGIRHAPSASSFWRFVEGVGPYQVQVFVVRDGFGYHETTYTTYVRRGGVEAGRSYQPGWWHDLVRLEEGDRYQYEDYGASTPSGVRRTYEDWAVRGDTVVGGTALVLVEQREYAPGGALQRESRCGVAKGAGGVTTVTLAGAACTTIRTGEIWWFRHLRAVAAPGGTYPGSYSIVGPFNRYSSYTFAAPLGYVQYENASTQGSMGAHYVFRFSLRYARVDGAEYGAQVVAGEEEPTAASPTLRAHPNPFHSALHLDVGGTRPGLAEVDVLDVLGRRVVAMSVAAPGTHRLDLSALPPGTYVVRTTLDDGAVLTRRVTKVR